MNPLKVLIVGAGPVGLVAALKLARADVSIRVIDKEAGGAGRSYALAVHGTALNTLDRLGLGDVIREEGRRVDRLGFFDRNSEKASVALGSAEDDQPGLVILQQSRLESMLEGALRESGVEVEWRRRLSALKVGGDRVRATIQRLKTDVMGYIIPHSEVVVAGEEELEVPWLIGADGHHSLVRQAMGWDFKSVGRPQTYAVFEFRSNARIDRVCVGITDGLTNVLWPLPDGYYRWSFQLRDEVADEESRVKDRTTYQVVGPGAYPTLGDERLRELIAERAHWFEGEVDDIRWRILVRFARRVSDCFGQGPVWLCGDAGHTALPAAVQSMNVGIREAETLCEHLLGTLDGRGARPYLEAYGEQRLAEWTSLLHLGSHLEVQSDADPWVRTHAAQLVPSLPASGPALKALAEQLRVAA